MKDNFIGQTSLFVPVGALPGDAKLGLVGGTDVPAAIQTIVTSHYGGTFQAIAALLYERDSTDYWFDVLINDTSAPGNVIVARGYIGAISEISQDWQFSLTSDSVSVHIGTGPQDSSVQIGAIANGSQINVLGNPQNRVDLNASTAIQLLLSSVVKLRLDSTGIHTQNGATLAIESGTMLDVNAGSSFFIGNNQINGNTFTYIPVLTNITVGNGTLVGKYRYLSDHLVKTWGSFTAGSTSGFAGGDFNISLPVIPFVAPGTVGAGYFHQNSTGKTWPGVIALFGSIMFGVALTNNVSGSNPFSWTTGDMFLWDITYEI